ncbi:hypothetical protein PVK06_028058 [Gossypium arboreum]|uniref:Uncharacterized protein n=1 Tax=Gossypium arboreum TaxID=29729 RepID=A0ABR0P412_GOSAR|nr:hypothetical protein PVK06_028058 [Gossypium arboreum]
MSGPPSPLIENYLRGSGLWHVATIGQGCKLDPRLISALIERGRIEIGWLRDTFLEPDNDLTELERLRYTRAYIFEMIGGYLMPDLSRNCVPLVNYAIVEMHQSDKVLQQFRFPQPIPVTSEVLDDEHKVDLCLLNTDWPRYWSEYIEIWEKRYDYIPTREPIIVPELACMPEYMPQFRIHGKLYLLSEEERRGKICV